MNDSFKIIKSADDQQLVFGWGNVAIRKDGTEIEDFQHDVVDPEELEQAAYNFVLNFRDAGEKHDPGMRKKGKLIESIVFTKEKMAAMGIPKGVVPEGWWVGFKIEDKAAWEKIKNGEYQMFSIEGSAERVPVDGIKKTAEDSGQDFTPMAKTFSDLIEKYNPYHAKDGKFTTANGGNVAFFSLPKDPAQREKWKEKEGARVAAEEAAKKPAKRELKLNEDYIRRANDASMFDAGKGLAREAQGKIDAFDEKFKEDPSWTDEQKAYVAQRRDEYVALVEQSYNDMIRRRAENPSWMVTGRANYNWNAHEKKMRAADNAAQESADKMKRFEENTEKGIKQRVPIETEIARWRSGKFGHGETISADDPYAREKMQAKLDYLKESHTNMKNANAYYRKNGTMNGFPGFSEKTNAKVQAQIDDLERRGYKQSSPFSLTSSNRQIKDTEQRLKNLQKPKSTESGSGAGGYSFSGGKVVNNADKNRLQIVFDSKPDADMRSKLKSEGFRWAPSEGAWQRQLTSNAEAAAKRILGDSIEKSTSVTVAKAFSECLRKYNPYHDRLGRFASANSGAAASFSLPKDPKQREAAIAREKVRSAAFTGRTIINPKDIASGEHTISKYLDADGNLTPEREALHQEAVYKFLAGVEKAAPGEATFYVMGGGPAAGKSSITENHKELLPGDGKAVTVDVDACKKLLPEYNEMVAAGNPYAAKIAHEESSALAKRITRAAQENGYNVVLDGTGDGKVEGLVAKINQARSNGMKVVGIYATVPTEVAVERSNARGMRTGRIVPEEIIRNTHREVSRILPQVADKFDSVQLFDTNSTDRSIKLIATGGSGKGLTPTQGNEALYQDFLDKAK